MSDAPLMLSVSGMRGLVGKSLTPAVVCDYAAAFGSWLREMTDNPAPHVVLGRDSRPSGDMFESAAAAGLTSVGCRVTRLGIVSTPGVAVMTEHLHAHGGMVVTASHNPIIWNGLKALRHDGVAPPPDQAQQIIDRFRARRFDYAAVEALAPVTLNDTSHRVHVDKVLGQVDVAAIRKAKLKVVLDSVHGAGGPETAMLMRELGVELVHLWAEPTGLFPHTPEPTRENLTALADATRQHGAHIGLAQDPDADRLAVVDEQGTYIGEEYTLALCAKHVLGQTSGPGRCVAANLSTSRMLDDIAAAHDVTVLRTAVGEANVAGAMREAGAVIGGEGNGGVIWPAVIHVRDSLVGAALLLELLATDRRPLSAIVSDIPRYAIVKHKLDIQPGMTDGLGDKLATAFPEARCDTQDGVRLDWPDRWVHVRPSNTEPILRLIAEAREAADAEALVAKVKAATGL